jgi:hypothetical protein
MSDDAPTKRLPITPPPTPPERPARRERRERPSRAPMIAFIVLLVLLLAAIGVLAYVLVTRGSTATAQPSNSPSASPAPVASQPTTPPAPPPPGVFTSFVVPPSQQCSGHGNRRQSQETDAQVTWATTNATQVWVAQGTADAASAGLEQVPLSGNQDSFPTPLPIDCNQRSMTFTMTLIGADGVHVSRTWTVQIERHRGVP